MGTPCKMISPTVFILVLLLPISLLPSPVSTTNAHLEFEGKVKEIRRSLINVNPGLSQRQHPGGADCGSHCPPIGS
ncbi:hypothetical protein GQ457_05G032990 [Hibiscus cannabinus]